MRFCKKPAPIQISWMGIPVSTGLDAMDYKFSDQFFIDACDLEHNSSEKMIALPWITAFKPLLDLPALVQPPSMDSGYVTFGSFNGLRKINNDIIQVWANILKLVPKSKINMLIENYDNEDMKNFTYGLFEKHGIDRTRINFQGRMGISDYLISHNNVDIALDPYPYHGQTTTYYSLLMGIPVITCAGKSISSNFSSEVLSIVDKREWVAGDLDEYVEIAVSLASDVTALASIRSELRNKVEASKIMDYSGYTDSIQDALQKVWSDYCSETK